MDMPLALAIFFGFGLALGGIPGLQISLQYHRTNVSLRVSTLILTLVFTGVLTYMWLSDQGMIGAVTQTCLLLTLLSGIGVSVAISTMAAADKNK